MKTNKTNIASAVLLTMVSVKLYAAENGSSTYSGGSSNFGIAVYPTKAGNYLQENTVFLFSDSFHDANGDKADNNFDLKALTQSFRFITSWDKKFLNADAMATEVILSYTGVFNSYDVNGQKVDADRHGVSDIYIHPISLQWNVDENWSWAGSLVFRIPSDSDVSGQKFAIQPSVGFKYKHDTGVEFAVLPRVSLSFKNSETNYQNGTELFVDYSLTTRNGPLQWGISGYYAGQLENDEKNGVELRNSKTSGFGIGPGFRYNHGKFSSQFNWIHDVFAENKSKNDTMSFSIIFAY